ncbi:MAG TPA: hypothetical protein VGL71_00560 [Urbifossiella sp.]
MPSRLQAPLANGAVLAEPGFSAIPALVEANRQLLDRGDVRIGGATLRELRAVARREALEAASQYHLDGDAPNDGPLILAGHQPELSHPGVWIKNFALNGLARKLGGTPLNLIVDNDTIKHPSLKVPVYSADPAAVRLETVPFDHISGNPAYEDLRINIDQIFQNFPNRISELSGNWPFRSLILEAWPSTRRMYVSDLFSSLRWHHERQWGCRNLELPVSRLSRTSAFQCFVGHILDDMPRFRNCYNAAILAYRSANKIRSANHPAPELQPDEAPFWEIKDGRRKAVRRSSDATSPKIRPRALTLTLFARLCLGDFFIHGIGGGKYDEVTDTIIRDYFGIEPPAYQVLSATLHLPLPGFAATDDDVKRAARFLRDLHWNPQRHIAVDEVNNPRLMRLVADRITLAADEPARDDHEARREWFRRLQEMTERLRPYVSKLEPAARDLLERAELEVRANEVLRRRDYSWVLYPEEMLRPFLQRFLEV